MFEKKYHSTKKDFKTGIFYKLSLIFGFIFLIIFLFLKGIVFLIKNDIEFINFLNGISDSVIAFSIIFFGLGLLLYYIHRQFEKLEKIAEEIENNEEYLDTD